MPHLEQPVVQVLLVGGEGRAALPRAPEYGETEVEERQDEKIRAGKTLYGRNPAHIPTRRADTRVAMVARSKPTSTDSR